MNPMHGLNDASGNSAACNATCAVKRDRYSLALDVALTILEELDRLPPSNGPVRLAIVIGIVLDAIYESERQRSAT